MKKEKKAKVQGRKKRFFLNSAMFLALFGVSATAVYFTIPRNNGSTTSVDESEDPGKGGENQLTGRQKFISQLTSDAASGMNLSFSKFQAYFPGADKDDTSKGNLINGAGSELDLQVSGVSLHDISLGLKAKLDYNAKKRSLNLVKSAEDIYFSVDDDDNSTYSLKYKTTIEPQISTERDPKTGGVLQYEYGDVDWIIEDVLTILSDGGINVDLPSIDLNAIASGSSQTSDSTSGDSSSSSFDTSAIIDSLNNMTEDDAHKYYTWNLVLDGTTFPIGLRRDDKYHLAGVDFPAMTYSGDTATQGTFSIKNGTEELGTLAASATVNIGEAAINWNDFITGSVDDYKSLKNSADLFEKVARYVATPKFGLTAKNSLNVNNGKGLVLTHYKTGTDGKVGTDQLEQASFSLDASADFTNKSAKFGMDLGLKADNAESGINVSYFPDSEGKGYAYANVDNLMMAKVSKVTLDELTADLGDSLNSSSSDVSSTVSQSKEVSDLIEYVASNIPFIQSVVDGHYEGVLDFIQSITGNDNNITVTFTLSPLKLDGTITLTLDGTYGTHADAPTADSDDTYLTGITFSGVKFSAFELDGSINLAAYSDGYQNVTASDYDELDHVLGIKDQIEAISDSKEASLSLGGHIYSDKKDILGKQTGAKFTAAMGYSYNDKEAGVNLTVNQISEQYSQDHHFKFALTGENGNFTQTAFRYDSINDAAIDSSTGKDADGKPRTNPVSQSGVTGKMSVSSMQDIVNSVKAVVPDSSSSETNPFSKIASSVASLGTTSFGNDLINQKIGGLFEKKVLAEKASLGGDTNTFTLNGSLFGLSENPVVTITYAPNSTKDDGTAVNGGFSSAKFAMKNVEVNLGLTATDNVDAAVLNPLNGVDTSNFVDFNSIKDLVAHATGLKDLGKVQGSEPSVYDVGFDLDLVIGDYDINLLGAQLYLESLPDETKLHVSLPKIPVIKGVNGPDNATYFRAHEYEGYRNVDIYYDIKDGDTDGGTLYIARESSYGKVTQVKDTVTLTGKSLVEKTTVSGASYGYNGLGWLLEYVLGVNEDYLVKAASTTESSTFEGDSSDAATTADSSSSSSRSIDLFSSHFAHPEDFLNQYAYDSTSTTWSVGAKIGKLLDEPILGDAKLSMVGAAVTDNATSATKTWNVLKAINFNFDIVLGDPDNANRLILASLTASIHLDNVSNAVYADDWATNAKNGFDSVVSRDASTGALTFTWGDTYTKHYVANGDAALTPGNYYAGVTVPALNAADATTSS